MTFSAAMDIANRFNKPEYVFQPVRALNRLMHRRSPDMEFHLQALPWGLPLRFRPHDTIGACIWRMGVYDLCVSEVLWRLLDPGETGMDVGANIGHMTSLMARRVGRSGVVHAFEPNPEIYGELLHNIDLWQASSAIGRVSAHRIGLSDAEGRATLTLPEDYVTNRGTATLTPVSDARPSQLRTFEVDVQRLDGILDADSQIHVLKLDVEGHEHAVLNGAQQALDSHRIRDIVFEDLIGYPSRVSDMLEKRGYSVLRIGKRLGGLIVAQGCDPPVHDRYEPPSFVATADQKRALARLAPRGWRVLRTAP